MNMNEEAFIEKDWLTVQNYQFKLLVMIAVLAENHLAYRGKLKDMCAFLGVKSSAYNNKQIQEAIGKLEAKGDILVVHEGQTWTLTLSVKAERKPKVVRIKNAWIAAIQSYEAPKKEDCVSWENILKVLVYLCADKSEIKTYEGIGKDLLIDKKTVERAVKALSNTDFGDLELKKKLAWFKKNDEYKVIGQKIDVGLKFD